jgi:hypothetical protein
MSQSTLRIATTRQLEPSVRAAGFEPVILPEQVSTDFNRPLAKRLEDGAVYRPFLEKSDVDLVLDYNTGAMTFVPDGGDQPGAVALTTAALGIPYAACYLDPITSTMAGVEWGDHWHVLESPTWIKGISDTAHAEELIRFGVPNVLNVPMGGPDGEFTTEPRPEPDRGAVIAFLGHPASSWFRSNVPVLPHRLFAGLTAAAVHADMPDLPFHKIYYDLYEFGEPPLATDDAPTRARKVQQYYADKFTYNAYLAVRQRERWARFLKLKLGDQFELVGDHWGETYGLDHTPRIWDLDEVHRRMRHVPICLNLIKGNIETSLIVRHFEITAHGGFMLTYPTPELGQYFEIGKECEVFYSEADLLDKIEYYLSHPDQRYEIAAAGQRRTLAQHLTSHRIRSLVGVLQRGGVVRGEREREREGEGPTAPAVTAAREFVGVR